MFHCHRYSRVVILQTVYFKLRFTLSYRDVKELMSIRGIKVDHSTIQSIKITLIMTDATKSSSLIETYKIDLDSVLDVCARESYELPSNAGFVLELKTPSFF